MANLILEPREFRLLQGLQLMPRKSFSGRIRGERLTQKKGISIDFSDYRDYVEGDDLRHLDWNVLARLEHPIVKTYRDEEDLAVHLLVDTSASMSFGDPPKMELVRKLGTALGMMALSNGDALFPVALGQRERPPAAMRHRSSFVRLTAWLESQEADGKRTLASELRAFASSKARPGLVIILSDAMDADVTNAVKVVAGRGHEIFFVQVLSQIEVDPDLEGDLRLIDCESGADVEITANSFTMRHYRDKFEHHNADLKAALTRVGGRYHQVLVGTELEDVVQNVWRREGWVV